MIGTNLDILLAIFLNFKVDIDQVLYLKIGRSSKFVFTQTLQ